MRHLPRLLTALAALAVIAGCASAPVQIDRGPAEVRYLPGERPPGKDAYAGSTACRACHESAYLSWEGTDHARSLSSLPRAGPGKDVSCLRCHATGYGEATGYDGRRETGLGDVGCEACHGPSAAHSRDPAVPPSGKLRRDCPPCVVNEVCRLCHTPRWSPSFDPAEAFPRIRH